MARYAVYDHSAAHAAPGKRRPDELTFKLDHSIGAGQSFWWGSLLVKFRLVMHNEYVTLTSIIDCSKIGDAPGGAHDPVGVLAVLETLGTQCFKSSTNDTEMQREFNELFHGVWEKFDDALMPKGTVFLSDAPASYNPPHDAFGLKLGSEPFCDIRTILLRTLKDDQKFLPKRKTQNKSTLGQGRYFDKGTDKAPPATDDDSEKNTEFHKTLSVEAFDPGKFKELLGPVWSIVEACNGGHERARDLFFTANFMLDNRALFISALGSRSPYTHEDERNVEEAGRMPTRNLVFVNGEGGQDRWQLGRLIYRLNSLETLRRLAIRDLGAIRSTSPSLMTLGVDLDNLYQNRQEPGHGSSRNLFSFRFRELADIFSRLAAVGTAVPYGLAYRINRSRYAVVTFKSMLKDLRPTRIPGFQPYDEFIRRRLYPAFDSIDRIGRRMDSVRQRSETLLSLYQTSKMVEYQKLADYFIFIAGTYYLGQVLIKIGLPRFFDAYFLSGRELACKVKKLECDTFLLSPSYTATFLLSLLLIYFAKRLWERQES